MVKTQAKPQQITINPLIGPNQTHKLDGELSKIQGKKEYEPTPKSKQEINISYYQKNKERLKSQRQDKYQQNKEIEKAKRKQRYQQQKQQTELSIKQQSSKYYTAENIKILMSFKQYTELNQDKMKLWTDFNWTLKDCQENIKEGLGDITAIMKLEQVANNLIRDYWKTVKKEIRKGKSWNSLSEEHQDRLIKYWGYEKARVENGYIDEAERLERQGDSYLKEIEMAKYHEERGKIKCDCWQCEAKGEIQKEIKAEQRKIIKDYEAEQKEEIEWIKGDCSNCGEYKKVDSDSGLCKKCLAEDDL